MSTALTDIMSFVEILFGKKVKLCPPFLEYPKYPCAYPAKTILPVCDRSYGFGAGDEAKKLFHESPSSDLYPGNK